MTTLVDRWSEHVWAEVGRQDADGVRKIATILRQTAAGLDSFANEARVVEPEHSDPHGPRHQ